MPIEIQMHDNTSNINVIPRSKGEVFSAAGSSIDKNRFEMLLKEEIQNRIAGDQTLQNEIDNLNLNNVRYIRVDELEDGSIVLSLLNDREEVIDTKTITLTEKIIKEASLDYDNSKLIYTCNDESTIELDISDIVDKIFDLRHDLSVLDTRVEATEQSLSILNTETIPGINLTILNIQNDISDIQGDVSNIEQDIEGINLKLTEDDESISDINNHLSVLDSNMVAAELSIISLEEGKIDKDLSNYLNINPQEMTPEQIQNLLLYVSENGIPKYAKLNELGFSRVKDSSDFDRADSGDLLIDMN